MSRTKLLNPGPVTLTDRVRKTFEREDLCHREPEFAALTLDVIGRLTRVYTETQDDYTAVLMTGSGTCAVEAMLGSLVPRDARVLVVANGVYGERAANMLEAHGKRFELVRAGWLEPMNVADAVAKLSSGEFTHCVAVHHETTTGRLNDLSVLGRACKERGVGLLLDAVSSFGGEEIRWADWNVLGAAATANKCLHGVPGICFVLAKKSAFTGTSGATSVYLDLFRYQKEQLKGWSPFTQATHAMVAFQEALAELDDQGGWPKRNARYRALTSQSMRGLAEMGIGVLLESEQAYSSILTSYHLPKGLTYERLHDHLRSEGFVIYAGQGQFHGGIFRIAVMGDLTESDIERLLAATKTQLPAR